MAVASASALSTTDRSGRGLARRRRQNRGRAGVLAAVVGAATLVAASGTAQASPGGHDEDDAFRQVNLVSDLPGLAQVLDEEVKNPWGIALGPDTPLWVNNNFNPASAGCADCVPSPEDLLTKITLYSGANGHDPFTKVPLEVTASAPTGMVFNPTKSFVVEQDGVRSPARFLFNEAVLDAAGTGPVGEVTGWSNATDPLPTTTATTPAQHDGAFYFGLALVPGESDEYGEHGEHGKSDDASPNLVAVGQAADEAGSPVVDVFDDAFHKVDLPGAFVDPDAGGLTPYNVAYLDGRVYIAYTTLGPPSDGVTDALSVFTPQGEFIKRLVTGAPLAGAWGMVIAPEHWGDFGGALLVGNVNDGTINAFDPDDGELLGTVSDEHGDAIVNPGLWGLAFGNGTIGTPQTLLFAAGIGEAAGGFGDEIYEHGLVGLIEPVDNDHHGHGHDGEHGDGDGDELNRRQPYSDSGRRPAHRPRPLHPRHRRSTPQQPRATVARHRARFSNVARRVDWTGRGGGVSALGTPPPATRTAGPGSPWRRSAAAPSRGPSTQSRHRRQVARRRGR